MTFSATMRIESVGSNEAHASSVEGSVTSNTEGNIDKVDVRLTFGEGESKPTVGTEFTISGSFEAPAASVAGTGTTTAQQPADQPGGDNTGTGTGTGGGEPQPSGAE